jgi:hypothetical protein
MYFFPNFDRGPDIFDENADTLEAIYSNKELPKVSYKDANT